MVFGKIARTGTQSLPDLRALDIFVAVVDGGEMVAAARQLGLTQSAVSKSIAATERQFHRPLLDRRQRPLRPTRAGQVLYQQALRILQDAYGLPGLLSAAENDAIPSLRIGIVESFTATGPAFVKAIQAMAQEVRISCSLTPALADGLRQWAVDLVISSDPVDGEPGLDRRVLLREPFIVVAPAGFAAPRNVEELRALAAQLPFIRYTTRSKIGRAIEQHVARLRLDAASNLEFDTSGSLLTMVAAGLGWTITTPLCLLQGRPGWRDLTLGPMPTLPKRQLYLLHRSGELDGPAEQVFQLAVGLLKRLMIDAYGTGAPWLVDEITFPGVSQT